MFCPDDCFSRHPTLRIRPVPEMNCCLVFVPERARLHTLNAPAWLALELCDGRDARALAAAYRSTLGGAGDAAADAAIESELAGVLDALERNGIVERVRRPRPSPCNPLDPGERHEAAQRSRSRTPARAQVRA